RALAVMPERLVRHDRPEVRSANADVDDVLDSLAGVAFPRAAADLVGEGRHLVEHGMDLSDHVLAIDDDRCSFRSAQDHVEDGPLFRDVDLLAAKHGGDPGPQTAFL